MNTIEIKISKTKSKIKGKNILTAVEVFLMKNNLLKENLTAEQAKELLEDISFHLQSFNFIIEE